MSHSNLARAHTAAQDELKDRVILVTGAGNGIGHTVALALAAHGATVILSGRNVRRLEKTYDQIVAGGGAQPGIAPLNLEKALAADYDRMAEAIGATYGRLDGLLHNAAILGQLSPIDHYDVPTWYRVMHVNVTAAFALTQVCMPLLRKSQDASVVFTSSGVGRRGRALWGAYAVSKFAVEGLSEVLADETRDTPIRVNTINPGATRTNMRLEAYPAEDRSKLADPAQLVPSYLYLLGPASRGISGARFDCQQAGAPAVSSSSPAG
jgi:NAD(P)-dependent dehydrogenase (short-subunit alcohol dehydrogenase family)